MEHRANDTDDTDDSPPRHAVSPRPRVDSLQAELSQDALTQPALQVFDPQLEADLLEARQETRRSIQTNASKELSALAKREGLVIRKTNETTPLCAGTQRKAGGAAASEPAPSGVKATLKAAAKGGAMGALALARGASSIAAGATGDDSGRAEPTRYGTFT